MARMAQYIGLTAAARRYVDTKLMTVLENDPTGDLHRKYYYDLADNEHPLGVWKEPDEEVYYFESIQTVIHSSGPMYFTHLMRYEMDSDSPWSKYECWKPKDDIHHLGSDWDLNEGVIYNIELEVIDSSTFPYLGNEIYYVQDLRHFVWRGNEQPVLLTFQDSGFRLLNQNKVMLMKINSLPYLVKADSDDKIYSIQLLDRHPELNDLTGISRKTVPSLIFDINSAAYKRFR